MMAQQDITLSEVKRLLVENAGFSETANASSIQALDTKEYDLETPYGIIRIAVRGSSKGARPVILTVHDIGMNHKSCFDTLFNSEDMQEIILHFAIYHINLPGQQERAPSFPHGYEYPSLDQMAELLPAVLKHFSLKSVIGLGVGAGANILTRFALNYNDLVEGLCLININCNAEGWMDWAATKLSGWTSNLTDIVISHLFNKDEIHTNPNLIHTYRNHISTGLNHHNLQLFVNSYNSRRDLEIGRPFPGQHSHRATLQCPSLLVVGDNSPAVDAVVDCNTKLDPTKTTLLKMSDCGGLPQVVQPAKLTEAIKYFVQGMGYMPAASMTRLMRSRSASGSSVASMDGNRSRSATGEAAKFYSHPSLGLQNINKNANANVGVVEHSGPQSAEISC
ncbi:protein NDRG1-like isoform X1 [Amblyraja radiata]|uniref:protein NDRG1-like isoform X1 n=1 Tax=Amblyraja radiata TaxID=386614 RepID=UPI001402C66E|nr:protein NDRG1-like isoform X1 [Amblyraja radiata]